MLTFEAIALIYGVGVFFSAVDSIKTVYHYQLMKRQIDVHFLAINQKLRWYVWSKPLLWPWYFMVYKSPLERVSELFFKYYGEEGHSITAAEVLKTFLMIFLREKTATAATKRQYVAG